MPKNAGVEELLVVARGDAAVVRAQRAAERMGRHVEPAAIEIEADRRGRLAAEALLHVDGKLRCSTAVFGRRRLCCDFRHQRHQVLAQPGQHPATLAVSSSGS